MIDPNARQGSMLTGLTPHEAADVQTMAARLLDRLDGEDDYLAMRALLAAADRHAGSRFPPRSMEMFRRSLVKFAWTWNRRMRDA